MSDRLPSREARRRIVAAKNKHNTAAKELSDVVKRVYPVGALLTVTVGKARIACEVIGHTQCWWNEPSEIRVRNIRTSKERWITASYAGHEIDIIAIKDLEHSP